MSEQEEIIQEMSQEELEMLGFHSVNEEASDETSQESEYVETAEPVHTARTKYHDGKRLITDADLDRSWKKVDIKEEEPEEEPMPKKAVKADIESVSAYKIGKKFEFEGIKAKVCDGKTLSDEERCAKCVFNDLPVNRFCAFAKCTANMRTDNSEVYYGPAD